MERFTYWNVEIEEEATGKVASRWVRADSSTLAAEKALYGKTGWRVVKVEFDCEEVEW
jgi:hypothetical protein